MSEIKVNLQPIFSINNQLKALRNLEQGLDSINMVSINIYEISSESKLLMITKTIYFLSDKKIKENSFMSNDPDAIRNDFLLSAKMKSGEHIIPDTISESIKFLTNYFYGEQ